MFSYYGSECFSNNKSLCKQVLTLKKKKKQGSSNAQQKYISKRRHGHRRGGGFCPYCNLPGTSWSPGEERKVWAWSAGVLFSRFVFGHHGWTDEHAGVETEYDTNGEGLWSYGGVWRCFDPNGQKGTDQTANTHRTEDVTSVKNNLWSVGIPQRRACTGFFSLKRYLWLQFKHTATYDSTRGTRMPIFTSK